MKTAHQLPLLFDAAKLQEELNGVLVNWTSHFNTDYYSGDWSGIVLRGPIDTSHGLSAGNVASGGFEDKPIYGDLSYTKKAVDALQCPKLSVRFLRLQPNSEIREHKDFDMVFWDGYVRIHIPVFTNPEVEFIVDNARIDMKEGECWFADFSKSHSVVNKGNSARVHLVIDCEVNDWLKDLFLSEGIIQANEVPETQEDQMTLAQKKEMIAQLLSHDNANSTKLAQDLARQFGVSLD